MYFYYKAFFNEIVAFKRDGLSRVAVMAKAQLAFGQVS
jgi:hypothetical protein